MEIIRLCRFFRNVSSCAVIAGMISSYTPAVVWGAAAYLVTLALSQIMIEGFFMSAYEEYLKGDNHEPKRDGPVGGSDVTKTGP